MGIHRADGTMVGHVGVAADGKTRIFERQVPFGFFIVIEAARGMSNSPVGQVTFDWSPSDPNVLPNLRLFVSRAIGNGSLAVCDDGPEQPIGGVPAVDPPMLDGSQRVSNAVNDLGCRFEARTQSDLACTRNASQEPAFVNPRPGLVQFCPIIGIGSELAFAVGETRVTAIVTDVLGQPGPPESIIIRVLP
jgi:hypothetical protein